MKENKKKYVSYQVSRALKQVGFNDYCMCYYGGDALLDNFKSPAQNQQIKHTRSTAPCWCEAMDWIRETKGLEIEVSKSVIHFYDANETLLPPKYQFVIDKIGYTDDYLYHSADSDEWYEDYYQAREQGILKALELIQTA